MQISIKRSTRYWTGLRRILAIVPWLALSACGDGGGGGSSGGGGSGEVTALNGFYQARTGDREFISLLLPITNSSSSVQWYGWYFKSQSVNADPTLLSGVLDLGLNGAAQSNPAGIRAFISGKLATGSVSLSNASLARFRANVPEITQVASQTALAFDAVAATAAEYPLDAVASAAALAGQWSGYWSSAGSSYASTLTFNTVGRVTITGGLFPCDVLQLSLVPRSTGNAFTASLVIPVATICPWTPPSTPKTLNGIAFIHTPAGVSPRLEVMLLDSDGRGISFRGDLQP